MKQKYRSRHRRRPSSSSKEIKSNVDRHRHRGRPARFLKVQIKRSCACHDLTALPLSLFLTLPAYPFPARQRTSQKRAVRRLELAAFSLRKRTSQKRARALLGAPSPLPLPHKESSRAAGAQPTVHPRAITTTHNSDAYNDFMLSELR